MNFSNSIKNSEIIRKKHYLDACNIPCGRLASKVAILLMGKEKGESKLSFSSDMGDFVIVYNFEKAVFTGNKLENKVYYKHGQRIGNMKKTFLSEFSKDENLFKKILKNMLPKNKFLSPRLKRVTVFEGKEINE